MAVPGRKQGVEKRKGEKRAQKGTQPRRNIKVPDHKPRPVLLSVLTRASLRAVKTSQNPKGLADVAAAAGVWPSGPPEPQLSHPPFYDL